MTFTAQVDEMARALEEARRENHIEDESLRTLYRAVQLIKLAIENEAAARSIAL